jgi:hypothetical protein
MPKVVGEFAQGESGDDVAHVVLRILEMVGGEGEWRFDVDLDVVGLTQLLDALGRWRGGQGSASAGSGRASCPWSPDARGGGWGGRLWRVGSRVCLKWMRFWGMCASLTVIERRDIPGRVCGAVVPRTQQVATSLMEGLRCGREGRDWRGPEGPEGWGKRKVCAYVEEAKWVVDVMGRCARGNVCVWRGGGGGMSCVHIS